MSVHIGAKEGDIAETVLMPGDPLRAKYIAENFLTDPICYNEVRGMYGYTGLYKGKRVSVQGSGMGIPSISIYVNELINSYKVKNIIRVGTCGGYSEKLKVRDLVIAMSSSTDSGVNKRIFNGMDYSPTADYELLSKAVEIAKKKGLNVAVGPILSTDTFYQPDGFSWRKWAEYGILAVEMETSALYTIAAKNNIKALTILTVSDHLATGEETTPKERETSFSDMIEVALELSNNI